MRSWIFAHSCGKGKGVLLTRGEAGQLAASTLPAEAPVVVAVIAGWQLQARHEMQGCERGYYWEHDAVSGITSNAGVSGVSDAKPTVIDIGLG